MSPTFSEEALALSDTLFKHLYLRSSIGYAAVSITDGTMLMANPALCGMLGYTETELKELRYQDIVYPDEGYTLDHGQMMNDIISSPDRAIDTEKAVLT
ncbi:PAS domain S-box protein [Paenibacillus rhizoplanae]